MFCSSLALVPVRRPIIINKQSINSQFLFISVVMYAGLREPSGGEPNCVYLAVVLSFIDLIPFFYIAGRPPPHLNKSPPRAPSDPGNQQAQRLQTWSQLFAKCSYQQNRSENIQIVCFKVFDPLPVFFFAVAFALAITLLIFNFVTITRDLSNIERAFRTVVHAVYAVELFTTALVYFINRHWCFDCKELVFICLIPILTTFFMPCNWHQCNGQHVQLQTIVAENQRVRFLAPSSHHLVPSPLIIIDTERPSPPPPCRPSEINADPRLENEYNDWLEAHRENTTQRQQI
jgi:hypothetical protein